MDKVFKVGVFGLTPNEQKALGSVFKLAVARTRRYAMLNAEARAKAEIILVDIDDPKAIKEWRSFNEKHSNIPLIKVTKGTPSETAKGTFLRRPLTLKRVLETLDDFTIRVLKYTLVAVDDNQAVDEREKRAIERTEPNAKAVRALVVDDALAVRKSMEIQLGIFGMAIDFAETGEEALEFTKKNVYDIIFLDLMLPGIDGYRVCKTIKSEKLSKNTPVVMLTGKGGRFDRLKGTMAGAAVYLTKPVQPDKLKEVIKQILPQVAQVNT